MNDLDRKLKTARRRSRAKLACGVFGGLAGLAVIGSLVYLDRVPFRIAPPPAAQGASVSVTGGVGVVVFDAAYVFGGRVTLNFASPGFISRALEVDPEKDDLPLRVEMREAPVPVTVTTEPASARTRWYVNGEYAASAARFEGAFPPGAARIEVDSEFHRRETLQLEIRRGENLARHLNLRPVAGALAVRSEPAGAKVMLNDEEQGLTPMRMAVVPGGRHRLRVILPGYREVEEEIVVTNALAEIARDYRLEPRQTAVRVKALPAGGVLRVNGVAADAASPLSLAVGRAHVVRYEKPGYFPESREVRPGAGEAMEVSFALREEIGEVNIRSAPSADVIIDGQRVGETPLTLRLRALPRKIALERAGYRRVELSVTPSAAGAVLIDENLVTELAARLSEAQPVLTAAADVTMKLFDPRARAGGRFTMGAPPNDRHRRADEFQRRVHLTKPFYISATEITEAQFARYKPLRGAGTKRPVRNVSWPEAAAFCNWMSARDGLRPAYDLADGQLRGFDGTADGYRLPSEAEWEWLARVAGRSGAARFVWGDDATIPAGSGNLADESARGSVPEYIPRYNDGFAGVAPVASFVADAAGLYDMVGNVSEWVHDVYDLRPPAPGRVERDPFGASAGDGEQGVRVVKGASFRSASVTVLRSSYRRGRAEGGDDIGFRVARYLYGRE